MGPSAANTGGASQRAASDMTDAALEFAEERGLGKVSGQVRLGSTLAVTDGTRAPAQLFLCSSGLWLIAAHDRFRGLAVDVLTHGDLRLERGRFRDQLCFAREELTIPVGRRHAVERLIGLGRLASQALATASPPEPSRLVQESDELGHAWLLREMATGEVLIAWLRGANELRLTSHLLGPIGCAPYLFLTDRRAAIVAWSRVGDVSYTTLIAASLELRASDEQLELSSLGEVLFTARLREAGAVRDAFELLGMPPGKVRLLEAARRLWLSRERSPKDAARSLSLLEAASAQGSQRARFARLLAAAEDGSADASLPVPAVLAALGSGSLSPTALGDLWSSFRFSRLAGGTLVRGLLDAGEPARPFALALQRRAHDEPTADETVARVDLALIRFAVTKRLAASPHPDPRDQVFERILRPRGLAPEPDRALAPVLGPLPRELLLGTLSHPLARGQSSIVASAQELIAQYPEPDQAALSDYCEALDAGEHPEARRALDAARLAFALPQLHAYVSRGKKSIGLRGYESSAPYLLLGNAHLDPGSPFRMSEAELHYAIGAEALHLKLGQARLTSNEVWAGAFARTRGGVELLLGLLPLAKGLPLAASASKFLERIPEPALRRGLELLVRFGKNRDQSSVATSELSLINENLVAAHRLMQMNADRAGCVLCGDLHASLRGLLLVRPDTRSLLEAMTEQDLVTVLLTGEVEPALRADLIVRIAALFDFYESEAYVAVRRALFGVAS